MEPQVCLRFIMQGGAFIQCIYPSSEAKRIVQDWSQRKSMRLTRGEFYEGVDLDHVLAIHRIPDEMLQQMGQAKPTPGTQYPHTYFGKGTSGIN